MLDEKGLLARVSAHRHPFLVNLRAAFQVQQIPYCVEVQHDCMTWSLVH